MEQIKEINEHIKEALDMWAGVMLKAEADHWAYHLEYDRRDVEDVAYIFIHVLSNIGIKNGIIDEEKSVEFGNKLHDLILSMTGIDIREEGVK